MTATELQSLVEHFRREAEWVRESAAEHPHIVDPARAEKMAGGYERAVSGIEAVLAVLVGERRDAAE